MKKQKHRINIASTKPEKIDFREAAQRIAHNFMTAERELTPIILKEQMPVNEALVLIAVQGDGANAGNLKNHSMTEGDIISATFVLVELWKKGLFVPSPQFPFTLEQALKELENES